MSTLYVNTITPNSGDTVSVSGSLFVSGTINLGDANTDSVAFGADISSSITPNANNTYDLGSAGKSWNKGFANTILTNTITSSGGNTVISIGNTLYPVTSYANDLGSSAKVFKTLFVQSVSASGNVGASGIVTNTVGTTTVDTLILTASVISCSGTVTADSFQSMGGDDTLQFNDSLSVSGSVFAAQGVSASSGVFSTDVTVGDDLSLNSDSAVFNMGAGNDFKITHDGTTGALINGNPITIHSIESTLTLSGSDATVSASVGDVIIGAADNIIITAADDITVTADNVSMVANVTAAKIQSPTTAVTATDAGAAIPAGTSVALVNADGDANHIVILPAPVVGNIIHIIENGTTGYELRTTDPTSIAINGGTASGGESAIAGATTYIRCVCVSSTAWISTQFAADGTESKVEAAA
jgi:hypothetical protein